MKKLKESSLYSRLPELGDLENTISLLGNKARITEITQVEVSDKKTPISIPVYSIVLGSASPEAPVFAVFGGVHGLERIGTQVVTSYLSTIAELLKWDNLTNEILERVRLVFVPLVNPGGMFLESRSNPSGVDLMRNAPVEAEIKSRTKIYVGHRYSNKLPWYRGEKDAPMEKEASALVQLVKKEIFSSPISISVDVHSGFGVVDRLWFPYAKTRAPFPQISEVHALKTLLDKTYPNHIYCVEPQSKQYLTHGDLWDHLYDAYREENKKGIYLPFCLELGSWLWIKKNPKQLFSSLGVFNPIERHRYQRILRRHLLLMDFLLRATLSSSPWAHCPKEEKEKHHVHASKLWYGA